ncbi:MAG: carboxypeptidase-like regulatory domain-containing protein [Nitrospirota bacterium]
MKGVIIAVTCLFLIFGLGEPASATDLTGYWESMNYTCKNKSKGIKCKINGILTIQNIGSADAKTSFVRFSVSDDGLFSGEDRLLKQVDSGKVKAGKSRNKTLKYSFGYGEILDCKYILAVIDAGNTLAETDESNNIVPYGPFSCTLGSIQGSVADSQTMDAIQDASLSVQGTTLQTTTDALGHYMLQDVPAGVVTVVATASGYTSQSQTITVTANMKVTADFSLIPQSEITTQLVQPVDFQYLGAFRLPGGFERPATFAYGGNAMTFNPDGDQSGGSDGFPGSLFLTGHERMPYGELPNGNQFAEINIPVPVISKSPDALPIAGFIQEFRDADQGFFTTYDEIPRIGIQYLSTPATGPGLHIAWGQHFHESPEDQVPTHAWISPNLSSPGPQGAWYIGSQSFYSVNGYMFEIPASWAEVHARGRYLGTGRYRDGGWSGQGPQLFAYRPWIDNTGIPAAPGTRLQETVLLQYASSRETEDVVNHSLNGYQHPDEWEGGAWITTTTGKSAVLFAGTKGTGAKYWYGWAHPGGPEYPCIETEFLGQFPLCRLADGTSCPPADLTGCSGHSEYRGWWSTKFDAQFILYDPADLARVASGEMESWEPQPYAVIDIDDHLLDNPARVEEGMLGTGVQRKFRIGDVAYDRNNDLLYVLELFADETKPVVHVWRVR